ncbi:MAG: DUF2203 domain-containing protein [Acidobacteriota bacterium]|nr:DUF2203 domain-containing protein [Acidobacteriota bacterium]
MPDQPDLSRKIFTLHEARELLPTVRQLTEQAVHAAAALASRLQHLPEDDPARDSLGASLNDVVSGWATHLQDLGVEVKGLWLVDFDNGDGYYCWAYPEPSLSHYHGYEDGFAGRMTIQ